MLRVRCALWVAALITAAFGVVPAVAGATQLPGISSEFRYGPFVVSGDDQVLIPDYEIRHTGISSPTETQQDVNLFGSGHGPRAITKIRLPGEGVPKLAAAGGPAAVAWVEPPWAQPPCPHVPRCAGVYSALTAQLKRSEPIAGQTLSPVRIAANRYGDRLMAWTEADGLHVQLIDANGATQPPTTVAPTSARRYQISLADNDVGWVAWQSAKHLFVARVAGGTAATPIDLGRAPSSFEQGADSRGGLFLLTQGDRPRLLHLGGSAPARTAIAVPVGSELAVDRTGAVIASADRTLLLRRVNADGQASRPAPIEVPRPKGGLAFVYVQGVAVDQSDGTVHALLQDGRRSLIVDATRRLRPLRRRTIASHQDAVQIAAGSHGFYAASTERGVVADFGCDTCDSDLTHVDRLTVSVFRNGKRIGAQTFDDQTP